MSALCQSGHNAVQQEMIIFRQLYFLRAMPHVPVNDEPGFSLIRASPVRNAFGGQVIGSTARLRRRTSGSGSPLKSIVRVALVDPERDFSSVVQISKLHTSETLLVPREISERMVEPCRADPSRRLKIVFRVIHGFRADRKTALVGPQDGSPGYAQNQTIDGCGPERQVRMSAASVGTRVRAEVPGRCPHPKTAVRQRIFDANPERERIARLWMEDVFHHGPVWLALGGGPGGPADEAVDCIAVLRLVQRELVARPSNS